MAELIAALRGQPLQDGFAAQAKGERARAHEEAVKLAALFVYK